MEFDNLDSRPGKGPPGKSWNVGSGPGKSWNFMLAAELPTVLDCLTCMRGKKLITAICKFIRTL